MSQNSSHLAIHIPVQNIAMFRFLLEAYDNLALFTVMENIPSILILSFASESHEEIINMLVEISQSVKITWSDHFFLEE